MGLDTLEILVKVENTFGIQIPARQAEKITTVSDYYNTVWGYVDGRLGTKCASQMLFYQLRSSFASTLNFPAKNLQLDISPNNIFPLKNKRAIYAQFASVNNLQLPALRLQPVWEKFLAGFGIATIFTSLAVALISVNFFNASKLFLLSPVVAAALTWLISELLDVKRTVIPHINMRGFTQEILALNYATIIQKTGTSRKEMEAIINHIIANITGLDLQDISPDKSLTNDLGID